MNRNRRFATWSGVILGAALALVLNSVLAHAAGDEEGSLREEFHHSYPLSADGRIELSNINGAVHIRAWDQDQVKLDAVKRAETQEELNRAEIRVSASRDSISIETHYNNDSGMGGRHDHGATVEYTLQVPRRARLDEIKLVNGPLDVAGVLGEVRASLVNGRLEARELGGEASLSTVNGTLEAQFSHAGRIELSSVNGSIDLTLPANAQARLDASTVHGDIHNDFGLALSEHRFMGQELRGELGGGGEDIRLSDVNGTIAIHRAGGGNAPTSE